ncbi:uncharacterized protein E0L32_000058 [Thyridium curvatum]|uniref:Meiotically up-regulated 65 protein n=1 Tax=Thyridium curvatum TaxID=1093900 RepID=A0A507BAV0_9PEZI|nr:uncharacterized protein E0L32_000058 [Thyridium curvatum]TPX15724.1 hypothetical protein E0L32_000058 [Thyridium curvatum]
MPKIKPRSSRRAPGLKDSDYDHEINLVDHAASPSAQSPNLEASPSNHASKRDATQRAEASSSRAPEQRQDAPIPKITRQSDSFPKGRGPAVEVEGATPVERPQSPEAAQPRKPPREEPETVIDILYENERGGFLCGVALFSSKALGNLDPTPWTNAAHRPSPTDITTAQVPDPTWEWVWPEWRVNHDDDTDEGGWEYSFMFARKFSWHGPKWWNSFVRRRAWIRMRAKKQTSAQSENDPHLLNPEYFSVQPAASITRTSSRATSRLSGKASASMTSNAATDAEEKPDIEDIPTLMLVLRESRIDREKIEAIDNFLEHGEEELDKLEHEMHEIMSLFVFQASRKVLLSKLTHMYDETMKEKERPDSGPEIKRKADALSAAVKHADEELKKLEYWSDIKAMAESGESRGAVDTKKGWDESWQGVDKSGPAQPPAPDTPSEERK